MSKKTRPASALALLTAQLGTPTREIRLLPAGDFRPADGRAMPFGAWKLTAAEAGSLIAAAKAPANDFVIDYEHQTQLAASNGQPAPAAGWFKNIEFREGDGLYATDVRWTPAALKFLQGEEYRYLSSTFFFDEKTGQVQHLVCAALTNTPALDGLGDLRLAALRAHFLAEGTDHETADAAPASPGGTTHEAPMNPVLKALLSALGLPDAATEQEATTAVATLKAAADSVASLNCQIATLKAATPDPSKFASTETVVALNSELATLRAEKAERSVSDLLAAARTEGKVIAAPAEAHFREVGKSNLATLKAILETIPANPALAGASQTGGQAPAGTQADALDTSALAMCKAFGFSEAEFKAAA